MDRVATRRDALTYGRFAASALALAAAACPGPEAARSSSPPAAPATTTNSVDAPSRSLIAALAQAEVACAELAELGGELSTPHPELVIFREPFDQEPAADGWIEGRETQERATATRSRSRVRDPVDAIDVHFVPPGAAALHRVVPLARPHALVITARVRALDPDGAPPRLALVSLDELPAAGAPGRTPKSALAVHRTRGVPEAAVNAARARRDEWQTLAVVAPRDARRKGVRLSLFEGGGVLVDEIVVRRATPCEEIAGLREPNVARGHPLVADVRSGRAQMRSLLLTAGTRIRFELDVARSAPRLDAAVALHPRSGARRLRVAWRVDGETLADDELAAADDGFAPVQLALARFAGRRVSLELAAAGDPGAVAAIGDPWLLSGAPPRPGPNVLLISIDTLRRDALGCCGNAAARTPAIDALAAAGACFTNATSPAPFTLPSHASLFSGQHPLVHGAIDASRALDPERSSLLAERFAAAGWQTAAFTGGGFMHPDFGFARGFGSYGFRDPGGVDLMFQREPAPLAADGSQFAGLAPALDWLARRRDQPFLLFLHTYFVHNYVPSADYAARHGAHHRPDLPLEADGAFARELTEKFLELERQPGSGAELRRLYDAAVEEVDARLIAPLLAQLDRLGLAERTIVALVADHGEGFQEHGLLNHSRSLWQEMVAVPLILRGPGIPRGLRRDDPVGLEDLAPTLAAQLGIAADARCRGRDLFATADAASDDHEPPPRVLHLAHRIRQRAYRWDGLMLGRFTYLRDHSADGNAGDAGGTVREYLFDTAADPGQRRDLAPGRPAELAQLARRLEQAIADELRAAGQLPGNARDGERVGVDEELERRLQELGYGVK